MPDKIKASFIEPMLLVRTETMPDDQRRWDYELKLDGYRAIAFKTGGQASFVRAMIMISRIGTPLLRRRSGPFPDETVVDGGIVAVDEAGRPSFNALQDSAPSTAIFDYLFDVLILGGQDVMRGPLPVRRELLKDRVLPKLADPSLARSELVAAGPHYFDPCPWHGGPRREAPGKHVRTRPTVRRVAEDAAEPVARIRNRRHTVGGGGFDALVFGYYEGSRLLYAARTRNGFTPAARDQLFAKFRGLETALCPFANLPEAKAGRWGAGLTAENMKDCRWLRPELVAPFEFVEWTPDNHLRHSRFITLREDRSGKDVRRES